MANYTPESLARYFNQRVQRFGPTIDALQWNSQFSQYVRYDVLFADLPKKVKQFLILAVVVEIYHYLKVHAFELDYMGLDISADMVVAAQMAYPQGKFQCLSLDEVVSIKTFDVIVASGVFILRMDRHSI